MQERVNPSDPPSSLAEDKKNLKRLEEAGFESVEDLLEYLPSRYIEPCSIFSLSQVQGGRKACIIGEFGEI